MDVNPDPLVFYSVLVSMVLLSSPLKQNPFTHGQTSLLAFLPLAGHRSSRRDVSLFKRLCECLCFYPRVDFNDAAVCKVNGPFHMHVQGKKCTLACVP